MTSHDREGTRIFPAEDDINEERASSILRRVYCALREQGYDPVEQLVGYLLSGDPTYITESAGARQRVQQVERDELLQELVAFYVEKRE